MLNTKKLEMDGYWWLEDDDPAFEQISFTEAFRLFDEGGTGVLLYSYQTCPYCNRAVPILNEVLKEAGIKAYYVDVYEPEMTSEIDEKIFDERLHKLYECLDSVIKKEPNPETGELEPAFFVPEVLSIVDGEIKAHHTSLTDDFTLENEETQLTDAQRAELKSIYQNVIRHVKNAQ